MCIKGTDQMACYSGVGVIAGIIGACVFLAPGIVIGVSQGWHATAIALIVAGGLCFGPLYCGGSALGIRVSSLKREENAADPWSCCRDTI